jgi:hypothetical protein
MFSNYYLLIIGILYILLQRFWWFQEVSRVFFLSKHRCADDTDYNPATNSEAQS